MCALLVLRTGHAQEPENAAPLPTTTEVGEPSVVSETGIGGGAEEYSAGQGGSGTAGTTSTVTSSAAAPDGGADSASAGADAGTSTADQAVTAGPTTADGGAVQSAPAATRQDVQALQQELTQTQRALEETTQQMQQLQTQLQAQEQQVATSDTRALTHMLDAQSSGRDARVEELRTAVDAMEQLGALLLTGEDDIGDEVVIASRALADAQDGAAQWGSAEEADALTASIEALDRIPALIASRNFHLANIALFGAREHAQTALSLAESAQGR